MSGENDDVDVVCPDDVVATLRKSLDEAARQQRWEPLREPFHDALTYCRNFSCVDAPSVEDPLFEHVDAWMDGLFATSNLLYPTPPDNDGILQRELGRIPWWPNLSNPPSTADPIWKCMIDISSLLALSVLLRFQALGSQPNGGPLVAQDATPLLDAWHVSPSIRILVMKSAVYQCAVHENQRFLETLIGAGAVDAGWDEHEPEWLAGRCYDRCDRALTVACTKHNLAMVAALLRTRSDPVHLYLSDPGTPSPVECCILQDNGACLALLLGACFCVDFWETMWTQAVEVDARTTFAPILRPLLGRVVSPDMVGVICSFV